MKKKDKRLKEGQEMKIKKKKAKKKKGNKTILIKKRIDKERSKNGGTQAQGKEKTRKKLIRLTLKYI